MLSGPLGGSLFSRRSLTYTQIWTSTSTFQVTRRQRNLSLRIILKNRVLPLKPTPPLHRSFLLLTPEFLYSFMPASRRLLYFSFHVYLFPFVGPGAQATCSLPFNKYSFFFFYCLRFCWNILPQGLGGVPA